MKRIAFILPICVVMMLGSTANAQEKIDIRLNQELCIGLCGTNTMENSEFFKSANETPPRQTTFNSGFPSFQSGSFIGMKQFGIELNYFSANRPVFSSVHISNVISPERRIDDSEQMFYTGFTFGRSYYLNQPNSLPGTGAGKIVISDDENRVIYYARVGPGVGLGSVSHDFGNRSQVYFGVHTNGVVGVVKPFSRSSSVFIEFGSRVTWFPGLNEMRFMGGPHVSVGFQFSQTPLSMIR